MTLIADGALGLSLFELAGMRPGDTAMILGDSVKLIS
jgi:hypothetical protein